MFTDWLLLLVTRERGAHHQAEEHASGSQCQGYRLGSQDAASTQGLHHQRAIEEGD